MATEAASSFVSASDLSVDVSAASSVNPSAAEAEQEIGSIKQCAELVSGLNDNLMRTSQVPAMQRAVPHFQLPRLVCATGTYAMLENMRDNLDDSIAIASGWAELAAAACTDVAEGATTYVPHGGHGGHGGHSSTHRVPHLFGQPLFVVCHMCCRKAAVSGSTKRALPSSAAPSTRPATRRRGRN